MRRVLEEYNVDFMKIISFFERNGLGSSNEFSLDTVLSDEQYNAVCKRFKNKKRSLIKNINNDKKLNSNAKKRKHPINLEDDKNKLAKAYLSGYRTEVLSFYSSFTTCLGVLNELYKEHGHIDLREDLEPIFGASYRFKFSDLLSQRGLFNKVSRYYYYDRNGEKNTILYKCLATLIVSILSEALNSNKLSEPLYRLLIKKYMPDEKLPIKSIPEKRGKKKRKKPRQWFSVVSVPFGGMNKRY